MLVNFTSVINDLAREFNIVFGVIKRQYLPAFMGKKDSREIKYFLSSTPRLAIWNITLVQFRTHCVIQYTTRFRTECILLFCNSFNNKVPFEIVHCRWRYLQIVLLHILSRFKYNCIYSGDVWLHLTAQVAVLCLLHECMWKLSFYSNTTDKRAPLVSFNLFLRGLPRSYWHSHCRRWEIQSPSKLLHRRRKLLN